jgi:hypothetical protein
MANGEEREIKSGLTPDGSNLLKPKPLRLPSCTEGANGGLRAVWHHPRQGSTPSALQR